MALGAAQSAVIPDQLTCDLSRSGYRVEKHRILDFRIASSNIPHPFEVVWKLCNGRDEASRANALRGEINEFAGKLWRYETTLYRGTHYVER